MKEVKVLLASILGIGVTVNAARVPTHGILARDSNRRTGDHRHGRYTTLARSSVLYFPFFVNLYILIAIIM